MARRADWPRSRGPPEAARVLVRAQTAAAAVAGAALHACVAAGGAADRAQPALGQSAGPHRRCAAADRRLPRLGPLLLTLPLRLLPALPLLLLPLLLLLLLL
mgnify:CR=1 FL=1